MTVNHSSLPKPLSRQVVSVVATAALAVCGFAGFTVWRSQPQPAPPPSTTTEPQPKTVTALGRLEPQGEVVKLSAPSSVEGSRVETLRVREGDRVSAGQVIAVLDSRDRLQAAVEEAQSGVRVAEANLAKVRAGAKQGELQAQRATISRLQAEQGGDIAAQAATVERLQAELRNAQVEDQRYQALFQQGAISESQRDSKRLTVDTAQEKLQEAQVTLERTRSSKQEQILEARATLDKIAEVRPVDVEAAQAEVTSALASLKRAQANLDQAFIRSPRPGQILKIHTYPGEIVSSDGIAEIGQTGAMYAIAEVYESDVSQVRPGQPVTVTSDSIPDTLKGTVEYVGLQVKKQDVINTDPSANIDSRIVEVKVRLNRDSSQKAAKFTNLQVKTVIQTGARD